LSDFTVIMSVRHRFGDQKPDDPYEENADVSAPFVGPSADFAFSCRGADSSQEAVLVFEHRGSKQAVTFPDPQGDARLFGITEEHPVSINGILLFGGGPAAPFSSVMPMWSTRTLIVQPGVLRTQNTLHIETGPGLRANNLDDFTIDNAVIYFKTGSIISQNP
jgi:hypothetical protein